MQQRQGDRRAPRVSATPAPASGILRAAALTALIIAALYFAQPVLKPLALAALVAMVLAPPANFLESRGLGRAVAAAALILVALSLFAAACVAVSYELAGLADDLDVYRATFQQKLSALSGHDSLLSRAANMVTQLGDTLGAFLSAQRPDMEVRVITDPLDRLYALLAPYVALLGSAAVVLVLVFFFLLNRDDLSDRIIGAFGQARISLTTRVLDEAGRRISRYLSTFALVNVLYGVAIGAGLWAIGLPLPVLWGGLAGALRFVPYVGAFAGFAGPMALSVMISPGWTVPLLVLLLFGAIEGVLVGFAEPILYGRSTGVSPVGLLVCALFWAWLWGPLGLLLATPLTASLAVAAKYVPGLRGLAVLLTERAALNPYLRLYQRLLAGDEEEAREMFEAASTRTSLAQALDSLLLPAAIKCQQDVDRFAITAEERERIWRALDDMLDAAEFDAGVAMTIVAPDHDEHGAAQTLRHVRVVGIGGGEPGDLLVLRMLNLLLAEWGSGIATISPETPAPAAIEWIERESPAAVVTSALSAAHRREVDALAASVIASTPRVSVIVGQWVAQQPAPPVGGEAPADALRAQTLSEAAELVLLRAQQPRDIVKLLTASLCEGDTARAAVQLDRAERAGPFDEVVRDVVEPVVKRLRSSRAEGRVLDDAFEFLRGRLRAHVTAVRTAASTGARALAACPGAPDDDLELLMLASALRARGCDVLYLGHSVLPADIAAIVTNAQPDVILLAGPRANLEGLPHALARVAGDTALPQLYVVGDTDLPMAGVKALPQSVGAAIGALEAEIATAA
jgi:predicted PurR-regulated permease PerM/methylmalonyl-CoA mutase cobalamin-binding subunit